ncbi:hypothetical protein [Limibacterium fermenti]|uniref:hypothetical protein n=1 Tax=Limibacterium fermenti TaxID=3229863 RepID=UPI000E9C55EE|nr:hypothetical protein [Porphyromonadaceae bacterium]
MEINIVNDFYTNSDKKRLPKKKIIAKGISFYLLALFLVLVSLGLLYFILKLTDIDTHQFQPVDSKTLKISDSIWFIVLIGPIMEEIGFRLGLSFRKRDMMVSFPVFVFIAMSIFSGDYLHFLIPKIGVSILLFLFIYLLPEHLFGKYKIKYGSKIIIGMTFLFALAHLVNFKLNMVFLPIYLLLCLPQLIMGMTFTYFRLNLGFLYAISAHILINSLSVLLPS